jgi:hypothetical protein
VRQIVDTLYSDKPDGLCGNEDCGQMSAWYVVSALGFYPVCPGRPEYAIGSPLFREAKIHIDDAHTFAIRADGDGPFVQSATLDGASLALPSIDHAAIVRGGTLTFAMAATESRWGGGERPPAQVRSSRTSITPVPFVARGERVFTGAQDIVLGVAPRVSEPARHDDDAIASVRLEPVDVEVSVDGGAFRAYEGPIHIDRTTDIDVVGTPRRRAIDSMGSSRPPSKRAHARFAKIPHDWTLTLAHPYAPQYAANGPTTLIDGLRGGSDFRTGDWQGFSGVDVDATIDLGAEREITQLRVGFLQDQRSWIWFPEEVRFSASSDGKEFRELGVMTNKEDEHDETARSLVYVVNAKTRARYVRVVGRNRGTCPAWHPGAGHPAWLFADEIGLDLGE